MELLLSRMDLTRPGMEEVKAVRKDTVKAGKALLAYFRKRTSVEHPLDRSKRKSYLGKPLSRQDLQREGEGWLSLNAEYLGRPLSRQDRQRADDSLKHIFVGAPSYPSFYRGKDIDWTTNPVKDFEWIVQLHRMYWWPSMGKAYWHTGDEKYAREWAAQLADWIRKNPRDRRHRVAWRSLEVGLRSKQWTFMFQYFLDSAAFTPDVLVMFLNSFHEHASSSMRGYTKGRNKGVSEAEGLLYGGLVFPEFKDAAKWQAKAMLRLNREIRIQVHPDGHQRELSMDYHQVTLKAFANAWRLARMNKSEREFSRNYLPTVEKMVAAIVKLGLPDGRFAQFGDSWKASKGSVRRYFREHNWAGIFPRKDFRYLATGGKEGKPPVATAFALPDSGLYSMRSGWDENAVCMVLKCGRNGGWHCQPDNGTFELYARGRHLMPDSGSYIYGGDPEWRAWFRQTRAHQTMTLNGKDSAFRPKLLLWKPGKNLDVLVVENAAYRDLTHRRAVFFVKKNYFVIVDEALGEAGGDVRVHFQFGPGKAVFDGKSFLARTNFTKGVNLLVQAMPQPGMSLQEEEGWVSFEYAKKEKRPAFCYHIRKDGKMPGLRFVTVLVPFEGDIPTVQAAMKDKTAPGTRRLRLSVTVNGETVHIGCNLDSKTVWFRSANLQPSRDR